LKSEGSEGYYCKLIVGIKQDSNCFVSLFRNLMQPGILISLSIIWAE